MLKKIIVTVINRGMRLNFNWKKNLVFCMCVEGGGDVKNTVVIFIVYEF